MWQLAAPPMEADIQPKGTLYSKYSTRHSWPIATKLSPFVAHAWEVRRVNIHENYFFKTRDTAEKVLCSRGKVPFISDRSQPNLHHM